MAQNISDTVVSHVIDQITAVTKGYVEAYTTTEEEDLFAIVVREQNPDDLSGGTTYLETIDDNLMAGTPYSTIWSSILAWLTTRATAAGYAGLDLFLAGRHLRMPHTFNTYIYYPTYGINMTGADIFPDYYWNGTSWTQYEIATFAYGGTIVEVDTLPTAITAFWAQLTSTVAGPGSWTVTVDVHYPDASTGVETVVCTSGAETITDVGAQALIAFGAAGTASLAGTDKVYIDTPVGFVAGQTVLVWTGQYHSLLTEDYLGSSVGASAQIYVSPSDVGCFNVGDSLTIDDEDSAGAASNVILSINYETGLITFRANLPATDYTVAKNALVYKTTPDAYGHGEVHTVKAIVSGAAGYVQLNTNLQHTYVGTSCKLVRLVASVDDIATSSGGAGGDTISVKPCLERNITQGNII